MSWFQRLLRKGKLEEQLTRELRFHFDEHVQDLVGRGMDPAEAKRQARIALGGAEQVKEQCRDARGTRWLDDFLQDIRYALRSLRLRPGFAAVTLSTLGMGIGAVTVMFTVVDGVLLKPLSYPEPERLVGVHGKTEKFGDDRGVSYPNFRDCERENRSLAAIAAWRYGGGTLSGPGESEYVDGREISSELFSVFGIALAQGHPFSRDEDRLAAAPVAIISYGLWQRRFAGSPTAIGDRLLYDGKEYTIVGVTPAGFQLDGEADVFTPLGQNTDVRMRNRSANFLRVIGRLRPGVALSAAQADLSLVGHQLARQFPGENQGRTFEPEPLRQEIVGDVRPILWLLLGAVTLVLLIACVNVASLFLARAVSREREIAMRVALGASHGRLARQCLTESAVLGLCGGMLGVGLAAAGFRPFIAFWPGILPRSEEIQLDWRVLLFAACASLGSGLLFGLAPALRAPARKLDQTLRAGARTMMGGSRRLHSSFVVSQMALAMVLLVAAGLLGRAVLRLSSSDPGINLHNALTARVALSPGVLDDAGKIRATWQSLLDRARATSGVESVALSDIIPMRVGQNALGYWTTAAPPPPNQAPIALASSVTPDYLKAMGIPLHRGRFLDDHDRLGSEPVVVIDDVLAQHAFAGRDPVGQRLWIQAIGPNKVVGVVGHVRHWGLADDDGSRMRDQIYYPFAQVPDVLLRLFSTFMSMAVRTNIPPSQLIAPLRRELRREAGAPMLYDAHSMEELASRSLARQRFLTMLFGVFAGLALLLACIGIYGVLAYVTSQRVPEIGLRMALGASRSEVLRMVFGQSLRMILAGVLGGLAIALVGARLLERSVAGVRTAEPSTFVIMTLALVFAALAASFIPARRASRIDPLTALRAD